MIRAWKNVNLEDVDYLSAPNEATTTDLITPKKSASSTAIGARDGFNLIGLTSSSALGTDSTVPKQEEEGAPAMKVGCCLQLQHENFDKLRVGACGCVQHTE